MDLKFSKVTRKGPITIVTLSRPEVYNALHIDAHFELNKIFDDFSADPEQWVAIVTGAGDKAFCAGNDLKWQAAGGKRGWDTGGFAGLTSRFDCDKPIIAAVNGVAMGGGFEIALACDLIIASENATFALPEPRVGLAALAGGVHRLPRQIGLKRAMGMILTARHVSAKEGLELGFVNEVVPAGEALAAAERWAETIAKRRDGYRRAPPILLRPQLPLVGPIVRLVDGELVHRGLPEMLGQPRRLQIDFAFCNFLRQRAVQLDQRAVRAEQLFQPRGF